MKNRIVYRLNSNRSPVLAVAGLAVLVIPVVVGLVNASPVQTPADRPKFEAATIRPCRPNSQGVGGVGNGSMGTSPGRLHAKCVTVTGLIRFAYITFADPGITTIFGHDPLSGGPDWAKSEEYDIEAKAEGTPAGQLMMGPMLQVLLQDRFKLKIDRETRETPVYALIVAKGGPKLKQVEEGRCAPADIATMRNSCGLLAAGANSSVQFFGYSLDKTSDWLSRRLDRPVINKTGITGLFDFRLEYAPANTSAAAPNDPTFSDPLGRPSIFTAVQEQLGLKLESTRGPGEFLVIDHVEKPSEN
jgi:bla regulator protein BlaR1